MAKKEITKDYSYLKKDLLKVLILTGTLLILIIALFILEKKTNYILSLTEKIMNILIKK